MTTADPSPFHGPSPADFDGTEVVPLQDAAHHILQTGSLVLLALLVLATTIWFMRHRRRP